MSEKRTLKLLNEVLPDPRAARASSRAAGPRARTLEHMRRLAVAAAAGGATLVACKDKGYAVVDPMPRPATCRGAASAMKVTATWIGPLGPPAKDGGARGDGGARPLLEVIVNGAPDARLSSSATTARVSSAWLVSFDRLADGGVRLVLDVADAPGVSPRPDGWAPAERRDVSIGVAIDVTCEAGPGVLGITLSTSATRVPGQGVSATVYDE